MAARLVTKQEDIPQGAIKLTKEEALAHQWNIIKNWNNPFQVMFLRHGVEMSIGVGFACSAVTIAHFKKCFRVKNRGSMLLYAPALFSSVAVSIISLPKHITNNILLIKDTCPLCDQLKFAAAKLFSTIGYASVIGICGCSFIASIKHTYPLPDIEKDPKEYFRLMFKFFKEGSLRLQGVVAAELIFVMFLAYNQNREFSNVMMRLRTSEQSTALDVDKAFQPQFSNTEFN